MRLFPVIRICLYTLLPIIILTEAVGEGKMMIDGLHGMPNAEDYNVEIEAIYPEIDFTMFDAGRVPIYELLAEGSTHGDYNRDTVIAVVSEGVHAFYIVLDVNYESGPPIEQLPMLTVVCPDQTTKQGAYGICHIDDPLPGTYTIYIDWCEDRIMYRVGTGPYIWEVYPPEDYDGVLQMIGLSWMLFHGIPVPHSPNDLNRLQQMLDAGGSIGIIYDGAEPIAEKPVIHMFGSGEWNSTVSIDIPGRLSYVDPEPKSRRPLSWDMSSGSRNGEVYYEAVFARPLNFAYFDAEAGSVENQSWATLHDLKLLEFSPGKGYSITEAGTLKPGAIVRTGGSVKLPYSEAHSILDQQLRSEAFAAGMTINEVESFFTKYSWTSRVLTDVCRSEGPVCLYRIENEDYDALLPMRSESAFADVTRLLWAYSMFPDQLDEARAIHPRVPETGSPAHAEDGIFLHEYGFLREHYGGNALDELEAWGWQCYDLYLIDPTNYDQYELYILFHQWGASPLVQTLSQGVETVRGMNTCGIIPAAGEGEIVLSGDNDTWSPYPDSPFPEGSYPPVVVAREETAGGRLVGLADLHFLDDLYDNQQMMNNIFDWMVGENPVSGPDIDIPDAVVDTVLFGNRVAVSHLQVYNIGDESLVFSTTVPAVDWLTVTGPAEATLLPQQSMDYTLEWNSTELTGGVYETEWVFTTNDANEASLVWPVRLSVVGVSGSDPQAEGQIPTAFTLEAPYPNPFNPQTSVHFHVPSSGTVTFDLFNVLGQRVERLPVKTWTAGSHRILINLSGKPAGLYFLRAEYMTGSEIRKLMFLK